MVEGAPLLRGVRVKSPSRFESLPLRQAGSKFPSFFDHSDATATKRGFEPEIWKRGFDKIALGDFGRRATRRPKGRRPEARVNPSLSAKRHINSRWLRSDGCGSDEAGITPARAAPEGARRAAPSNPSLRPWKIPVKTGSCGRVKACEKTGYFLCQPTASHIGVLVHSYDTGLGWRGSVPAGDYSKQSTSHTSEALSDTAAERSRVEASQLAE